MLRCYQAGDMSVCPDILYQWWIFKKVVFFPSAAIFFVSWWELIYLRWSRVLQTGKEGTFTVSLSNPEGLPGTAVSQALLLRRSEKFVACSDCWKQCKIRALSSHQHESVRQKSWRNLSNIFNSRCTVSVDLKWYTKKVSWWFLRAYSDLGFPIVASATSFSLPALCSELWPVLHQQCSSEEQFISSRASQFKIFMAYVFSLCFLVLIQTFHKYVFPEQSRSCVFPSCSIYVLHLRTRFLEWFVIPPFMQLREKGAGSNSTNALLPILGSIITGRKSQTIGATRAGFVRWNKSMNNYCSGSRQHSYEGETGNTR